MVPCRHLAIVVLLLVNLNFDCPINTETNNQLNPIVKNSTSICITWPSQYLVVELYLTCHTLSTVKDPVGANKLYKKKSCETFLVCCETFLVCCETFPKNPLAVK